MKKGIGKERPKVVVRNLGGGDCPRELLPGLEGKWEDLPDRLSINQLQLVAHMVNDNDIARDHLHEEWELLHRMSAR